MRRRLFICLALVALFATALQLGCSKRTDQQSGSNSSFEIPESELANGWLVYAESAELREADVADMTPGNSSPEAAVSHYMASRIRGDRRFEEVLPSDSQRSSRLTRGLEEHDSWTFTAFRLVQRQAEDSGEIWVKVFFEISYEGDVDSGTDEFTVRKEGSVWVIVEVPT